MRSDPYTRVPSNGRIVTLVYFRIFSGSFPKEGYFACLVQGSVVRKPINADPRSRLSSRSLQMGLKPNVNPKIKKIFWKNLNSLVIKLELIYQTRERVFPPISKHREAGWKNEAQPSFLTNFEETLFRVFKIASQTIHNSWRNSEQKFTKFHDN